MKKYYCSLISNAFLIFSLVFIISCNGKKNTDNTKIELNNKSLIIENTEKITANTDWMINENFVNSHQGKTEIDHQIDFEEKTVTQTVKDILSPYKLQINENLVNIWNYYEKDWSKGEYSQIGNKDLKLRDVQYARIPFIDSDWTPIVFFANYKEKDDSYFSGIYLLIFWGKNGIVSYYNWKFIESSVNYIYIPLRNYQYDIEYNWVKDMPERWFGDSTSIVSDFNGDGYDEIMLIHRGDGSDYIEGTIYCSILGFDDEDDDVLISYKSIFKAPLRLFLHYSIEKWDFGPPIQFGAYKGIEGFIIYEDVPTGETGRQWVGLDPDEPFYDDWYEVYQVTEGIWNFYAWNKEEKKYVLIDRVKPDEIKTQWAKIGKSRN